MQTAQSDIMVDVKQVLGRENGAALVSELNGMHGVSRARVSPHTRRLVLVDYDPKVTDSHSILGTVRHRGFDARLVGM